MELTPEEKERIFERFAEGEPVTCVRCRKWIRPSEEIECDNSGPLHEQCAEDLRGERKRGEDPSVNHINQAVGC